MPPSQLTAKGLLAPFAFISKPANPIVSAPFQLMPKAEFPVMNKTGLAKGWEALRMNAVIAPPVPEPAPEGILIVVFEV